VNEWLSKLEPRERVVLGLGGLVAAVIIGWTFVWSPLRDRAAELDTAVADRAREVVDLRRAANLAATPGVAINEAAASSLLVLIDETARSVGLTAAITRSNQDGPDTISVSFRGARFDQLLSWLVDLEQRYGLAVVSAGVTPAAAGFVDGQVRLDRS